MSTYEKKSTIDLESELSKDLTIHKNFNQEIIVTTYDKLKIVLIETKESLTSKRDWITPFGLTVSFIATLCTAEFKDAFGLNKDVWHAIFILLTILSSGWLVVSVFKLIYNWRNDNIDSIIERIKPQLESIPASPDAVITSSPSVIDDEIKPNNSPRIYRAVMSRTLKRKDE